MTSRSANGGDARREHIRKWIVKAGTAGFHSICHYIRPRRACRFACVQRLCSMSALDRMSAPLLQPADITAHNGLIQGDAKMIRRLLKKMTHH